MKSETHLVGKVLGCVDNLRDALERRTRDECDHSEKWCGITNNVRQQTGCLLDGHAATQTQSLVEDKLEKKELGFELSADVSSDVPILS
jgi:hypothetical protein